MSPDVIAVEALPDYRLKLSFDTGLTREINIADVLDHKFTGIFEPLKNQDYFWKVSVNSDIGTIIWPNGADISPGLLYAHATGNLTAN